MVGGNNNIFGEGVVFVDNRNGQESITTFSLEQSADRKAKLLADLQLLLEQKMTGLPKESKDAFEQAAKAAAEVGTPQNSGQRR